MDPEIERIIVTAANQMRFQYYISEKVQEDFSYLQNVLTLRTKHNMIHAFNKYNRQYTRDYRYTLILGLSSGEASAFLILIISEMSKVALWAAGGLAIASSIAILVGTHMIKIRGVLKNKKELDSALNEEMRELVFFRSADEVFDRISEMFPGIFPNLDNEENEDW